MDNKDFETLLMAVYKKDIWDLRMEHVKKILGELLNDEFDEIREQKFLINIKKLESGINAQVFRKANPVIIELNEEYWERHPELDDHDDIGLRATLRHELTHILTDASDGDPLFELELKRRGRD